MRQADDNYALLSAASTGLETKSWLFFPHCEAFKPINEHVCQLYPSHQFVIESRSFQWSIFTVFHVGAHLLAVSCVKTGEQACVERLKLVTLSPHLARNTQ